MLQIGSKIFEVVEKNNIFSKNRLTMVDEEGNEWYRYDKPNLEYFIKEWTVVGLVQYHVKGELVEFVDPVHDGELEYHLRDGEGHESLYTRYDDNCHLSYIAACEQLEAKHEARNTS